MAIPWRTERQVDRNTRRETKWWTRYWRETKRQDGVKNEQENEGPMKMASLGMPSLSIRHQDCLDPPKSILKIDLCGDGKRKRQNREWVEGSRRESRSNRRKKINYESVHISVEDHWEQTQKNENGERREGRVWKEAWMRMWYRTTKDCFLKVP